MRLHRFYISEPVGIQKELTLKSAELVNQLHRVFRLKTGDEVVVFDGTGSDYVCAIEEFIAGDKVRLAVRSSSRSRYMPRRKIYLYAAIIKKDLFEMIVEKAAELGVTDIIPVMAERTEKKSLNESRLRKIAIEASEQSGRGDIPRIHKIVSVKDAVESVPDVQAIVFHTEGETLASEETDNDSAIAVFIGPEGGWSLTEIDLFHRNYMMIRTLGPQVLRAETAVISALSQVVFR